MKKDNSFRKIYPTVLFTVVMFFLTIYIYFPGIMTPDSIEALRQAESHIFIDLAPPSMPFVWSLLNHIYFGPVSMLVFNNTIFWAALCLFSLWLIPGSNIYRVIFIFLFGLFLPIFTQMGFIWKDITCFSSLFLACSLLLFAGDTSKNIMRFILIFTAICFLFFALTLRHNAFAALIVLCFWVVSLVFYRNLRYQSIKVAVFGAVLFGVLLLANKLFTDKLLNGYQCYPSQMIKLYDVFGISAVKGETIFPAYLEKKKNITKTIKEYSPGSNFFMAPYWSCNANENSELNKFWVHAIIQNPLAYLQHRMMVFGWLFIGGSPQYYMSSPNSYGFVFKPNYVFKQYYKFVDLFTIKLIFLKNVHSKYYPTYGHDMHVRPLFWGGIYWFGCLLISVVSFFSRRRLKNFSAIFGIALSGFIYGAGYIIYAPTCEYRFWMWTVVAFMVSTAIYIKNRFHSN